MNNTTVKSPMECVGRNVDFYKDDVYIEMFNTKQVKDATDANVTM